ncbi:MAG TPA: tetratricopeptide repeat protein [Alphaproteobacteria bacterium]|nr:tetratricopeptide repeat protein [Alphaproteobacteria bacterium]
MRKVAVVALAVLLMLSGSAWSMGGSSASSSTAPADPDFTKAVKAVNGADYAKAIALLEGVVAHDPKNADAWNYLGFSNRKLRKYPEALADYEKALAINPDHLGANEYLGELYLETGDLPKAEERLSKLDKLCIFGCEEYRTLKAAIDAKKKSG